MLSKNGIERKDSPYGLVVWPLWIGKEVKKRSGKTFKSGSHTAIVKGLTTHPITGLTAFLVDDTYIEAGQCVLLSDKPSWDGAPSWALGLALKCYEPDVNVWCWMAGTENNPGFICYETRPLSHYGAADERVKDIIDTNLYNVLDKQAEHRRQQSLRDRAKHASQG